MESSGNHCTCRSSWWTEGRDHEDFLEKHMPTFPSALFSWDLLIPSFGMNHFQCQSWIWNEETHKWLIHANRNRKYGWSLSVSSWIGRQNIVVNTHRGVHYSVSCPELLLWVYAIYAFRFSSPRNIRSVFLFYYLAFKYITFILAFPKYLQGRCSISYWSS